MSSLFVNVYALSEKNIASCSPMCQYGCQSRKQPGETEVEGRNLHTDKWAKFGLIIIQVVQERPR